MSIVNILTEEEDYTPRTDESVPNWVFRLAKIYTTSEVLEGFPCTIVVKSNNRVLKSYLNAAEKRRLLNVSYQVGFMCPRTNVGLNFVEIIFSKEVRSYLELLA